MMPWIYLRIWEDLLNSFIFSKILVKYLLYNRHLFSVHGVGGERICLQSRRPRFDSWVGKIPWGRKQLPIPVFWSGEFHRLYSPWGRKELDTTEWLSLSEEWLVPKCVNKQWEWDKQWLVLIQTAVNQGGKANRF